jgi:hypothetical protein
MDEREDAMFINRCLWMLLLLSLAGGLAGCAPKPDLPQPAAQAVRKEPVGHIKRGMDLRKIENDLTEIGLFHQHYWSENGKAPASLKDFEDYIRKDSPQICRAFEEEIFVYVPNVSMKPDMVLAYEKEVDLNGRQRVVFGDGHVEPMQAQELQNALKRKR